MKGAIEKLLYLSPRGLLYVSDLHNGEPAHRHDHLSCFLSGTLALGAQLIPVEYLDDQTRQLHRWAARGIAMTCFTLYIDQESHLSPDIVVFDEAPAKKWVDEVRAWNSSWIKWNPEPPGLREVPAKKGTTGRDYRITDERYLLRPEVRLFDSRSCCVWVADAHCSVTDGGEFVLHVQDHWGGGLEGARIRDLSGDRQEHHGALGLHERRPRQLGRSNAHKRAAEVRRSKPFWI